MLNPDDDPTRGLDKARRVGPFEMLDKLGEGGMGSVWRARDTRHNRIVAVKFLPEEARRQTDVQAQVRDAFSVAEHLTHANICKLLELYEDPLLGPCVVMELALGVSLKRFALGGRWPRGRMPLETALTILRPVAEALDYGHTEAVYYDVAKKEPRQKGVLHRDVKPPNIVVLAAEDDPRKVRKVTLVDYGIAAEIRSATTTFTNAKVDTKGTLPYMAPEQAEGRRARWDGRTDQYSLAVVAYELLAGHLPFESDGGDDVLLQAIASRPPDRIEGVPPEVNLALAKAMAKDRDGRFKTCCEFVDALRATSKASAAPPPPRETSARDLHLSLIQGALREKNWPGARAQIDAYLRGYPNDENVKRLDSQLREKEAQERPAVRRSGRAGENADDVLHATILDDERSGERESRSSGSTGSRLSSFAQSALAFSIDDWKAIAGCQRWAVRFAVAFVCGFTATVASSLAWGGFFVSFVPTAIAFCLIALALGVVGMHAWTCHRLWGVGWSLGSVAIPIALTIAGALLTPWFASLAWVGCILAINSRIVLAIREAGFAVDFWGSNDSRLT